MVLNIFLTGATGYIGGSIARRLTERGHSVRGLIRDTSKADALGAQGVVPVVGKLDDHDLLVDEARAADGVVNAADSMHRRCLEALIDGLRGSDKPLIHTSGIGMVSRDVLGDATSDDVLDDADAVIAGPHPAQQALRAQEAFVLEAAGAGVRTVVLSNSLLYGAALGLPAQSVQLPIMVRQARMSGEARFVGRGVNRWSTAHIADVADLYARALESAPAGTFCFVENGEASFAAIAGAIARRLGLGPARSWSLSEAAAALGEVPARFLLGTDARVHGTRARRQLGWAPRHVSVTEWIEGELPVSGVDA
jgi:nucleoside-diphosphate-sugar epimerase